ncbi:MAG: hypothetical protein WAL25_02905 [Acidimicrobiia bacterium]
MTNQPPPEVRQLRLVVEAEDFDEAVFFCRDVPKQAGRSGERPAYWFLSRDGGI